MNIENVVSIIFLIVVLYVAFRIGAVILKILLGLLAIAIVVWLVQGL
jgi:hypothetical protein